MNSLNVSECIGKKEKLKDIGRIDGVKVSIRLPKGGGWGAGTPG